MENPYFGIVQNAVPQPLPETHRVKWQPIGEYDGKSNVLFRAGTRPLRAYVDPLRKR